MSASSGAALFLSLEPGVHDEIAALASPPIRFAESIHFCMAFSTDLRYESLAFA